MHVRAGLTDQTDDIEGGVGEDRRVGLIQVVVRLLFAPNGFPGYAGGWSIGRR